MNNQKGFLTLLLVFAAILIGAAVLYGMLGDTPLPGNLATSQEQTAEPQGENMTAADFDFTVYDAAGNPVRLSDFAGKPVVLNFWASWCGPCKMEMPDFQSKYEELEGEVVFMMVNATDGGRETVETAKAYIEESGYTFPVYYDTQYDAIYTYGINAFPTTFFIDAEGYPVAYGQGAMSAAGLQQGIDMISK